MGSDRCSASPTSDLPEPGLPRFLHLDVFCTLTFYLHSNALAVYVTRVFQNIQLSRLERPASAAKDQVSLFSLHD